MFRDLPRYAETKATGLAWAKVIPATWHVQRAKSVMGVIDIRSAAGEEELLTVSSSRGVIPRASAKVSMFQAESYKGHKLCWPNDLVINSLWAWGRGLGVAGHHGIVSTAYGVYRLRDQVLDPGFLHELVRSEPFQWELQVRSQGVWKSRLQITDDRWLDAPLLVPPPEEQAAIVKYLAHANARIDKAIAAKRRLIALLGEQVDVIVREMLAGVAKSPYPCQVIATGRLCRIDTGTEDSGNAVPDGAYPFFVRGREVLRASDYHFDTEAVLTPGDGQGGTGKVFHYYNGKFQAHQRVYVCSEFSGVSARYFYWYMTAFFREHALSQSSTVTMESLRRRVLATFRVLVPEESTQRALVESIETKVADSARIVEETQREITLLQEFRTRLVADVVTGQVDVRAIAATLPDATTPVATSTNATTELYDQLQRLEEEEAE